MRDVSSTGIDELSLVDSGTCKNSFGVAEKTAMTDPKRLSQLLGRLDEVCNTANELAKEVKQQLRDVERQRQSERQPAQPPAAKSRTGRKKT